MAAFTPPAIFISFAIPLSAREDKTNPQKTEERKGKQNNCFPLRS
jgi:hypothetical protein